MQIKKIKDKINKYYSLKINTFGATNKGVDWSTKESQELRFKQLINIFKMDKFTVNDLGCGYGALYDYLFKNRYNYYYIGYDISQAMLRKANELFSNNTNCEFLLGTKLKSADYTLASGLFNVKLDIELSNWRKYIISTLNIMNKSSKKGFAFNMLSKYVDYARDYLYYADPLFFFDYCKNNYSRNISLLHDYDLYEFTLLIRK